MNAMHAVCRTVFADFIHYANNERNNKVIIYSCKLKGAHPARDGEQKTITIALLFDDSPLRANYLAPSSSKTLFLLVRTWARDDSAQPPNISLTSIIVQFIQ